MKKSILSLLFLSVSLISYCQIILPVDSVTKKITYTDVINVDGVNKSDLYSKVKVWFATAYTSSNNIIQLDDKASGKIIAKPVIVGYASYLGSKYVSYYIDYTITIYIKDGKYKYVLTDFIHRYVQGSQVSDYGNCENILNPIKKSALWEKEYNKVLITLDLGAKNIIESLKSDINSSKKNDNW